MTTCPWAAKSEILARYHDAEWGVPLLDDVGQFEFLTLESAQAGLSWLTILKRREGYRAAFAGFAPERVAAFTDRDVEALLQDARIIRNRAKVESAVSNARRFLEIQAERGSFAAFLWDYVDGRPIQNEWKESAQIPPATPLSQRVAKDMKQRGFRFLGPIVVYSHMQATGLVNDHLVDCPRYPVIRALGEAM